MNHLGWYAVNHGGLYRMSPYGEHPSVVDILPWLGRVRRRYVREEGTSRFVVIQWNDADPLAAVFAVMVRVRIRDALTSVAPVQEPAGIQQTTDGSHPGPASTNDATRTGARRLPVHVFLQLRGEADVHGTVDGRPFAGAGRV